MQDQITIRVTVIDNHEDSLVNFLSHYSVCQAVANIHLLPTSSSEPIANTMKAKMYKKARWLKSESELSDIDSGEAVLVLDSDILITCSDLEFAHSVWLSARDSAVGLYPRLVLKDFQGKFEYLGPLFVWWQVNKNPLTYISTLC